MGTRADFLGLVAYLFVMQGGLFDRELVAVEELPPPEDPPEPAEPPKAKPAAAAVATRD